MVEPTDGFEPPARSFTPLEIMPRCSLWAGGYSGVTFQNYSACLPRPRSGPGPVGRAEFNAPMEFLTGFTMQMALMGLKMMISCVTFSLTYFNPSRSFLRRQ